MTHDCRARFSTNHVVKYADDTTVVDLIQDDNEQANGEEERQLVDWCNKAKSPRWRFNISLLSNQTFIYSLKEYIKEFLEMNMPSDVDPQKLWEMTKCAIRGFCISFFFYSCQSENSPVYTIRK